MLLPRDVSTSISRISLNASVVAHDVKANEAGALSAAVAGLCASVHRGTFAVL